MKFFKVLNTQNLILLALVLVVAAVTGLNSYTVQTSTAYFNEASQYEARGLLYQKQVQESQNRAAQALGYAAYISVSNERVGQLLELAISERDEARETAIEQAGLVQCAEDFIDQQGAYIVALEKTLTSRNIPLPKNPIPQPTPAEKPQKKPAEAVFN